METIYRRPALLADLPTHYCPGCGHGTVHRLVAETIEGLGIGSRTICVAPVGCAVLAYKYFVLDCCVAAHGRAPAMATGLKRVLPDRVIFTYQGDGDLASIGGNEILHAALRGEPITIIFVNNGVYGMTGGQMAPTTPLGMRTTSSPLGRDSQQQGYPIHLPELLAALPGVAYAARRSTHSVAEIRRARQAIQRAFTVQLRGLGLGIVELLGACPTNWQVTPVEALEFIEQVMLPVYPLGEFKVAAELGA